MPLLTVPQVAEYLNLTERNIREMIYKRAIPYVKIGRLVRFDQGVIDEWVREHSRGAQ